MERIEAFKDWSENVQETFSDCAALKARVSSIWERERLLNDQQQESFHESEEQLSQRLGEPIQQQIDDNDTKLAGYERELTSISSEIKRLEVQMQPYDAEIAAIEDKYPKRVLPSDIFEEYERLLAEWNRLNDRRNALVQQYERIREEFNQLTEDTNKLIDELAWLP